ncbi:MAG: bifunctional tetrahydrofolate synthase/dihydrofolate synthase [Gammaproteobacteria bacterium]
MRFEHLKEWLDWQETLHSKKIELGLERIAEVASAMGVDKPAYNTIVVAGTNGKGSIVSTLESIYHHAGYRVGAYTSPHLLQYNERIRVNYKNIDDDSLCNAFNKVDEARGNTSLSYFEFGTLAAMQIFNASELDIAIYEVGLGGRLDAVNILDSDVAIISSIGIDHIQWLGATRELIGFEKAGVFRADHSAICGDSDPPDSLIQHAKKLGTELLFINQDYSFEINNDETWSFHSENLDWDNLPLPNLHGEVQIGNAATALMGLGQIDEKLPVTRESVERGLTNINLPGRFQRIQSTCEIILDVAHNLDSANVLATNLRGLKPATKTIAVFAVLSDKDVCGIIEAVGGLFDEWHISQLASERTLDKESLKKQLDNCCYDCDIYTHSSIAEAYNTAKSAASESMRIVVFGSFLTVAEVLNLEV